MAAYHLRAASRMSHSGARASFAKMVRRDRSSANRVRGEMSRLSGRWFVIDLLVCGVNHSFTRRSA